MGKPRIFSVLFLLIVLNISARVYSYKDRYKEQYEDHFVRDFETGYNDEVDQQDETENLFSNEQYQRGFENRAHFESDSLDIHMPNVSPRKHDTYFCTAAKMPEEDAYIVGYEPHAIKETAHHMLMFGCDEVDRKGSGEHWNCGEMGGTCSGQVNTIMYAWAKDAPALTLPKNVGFHVGGRSKIKYIVLQVHYAKVDKFKKYHKTDHSGVSLHLTSNKPKYFAGIYLVAAGGPPIPAQTPVFDMDMACQYTSGPKMHPFRFRVHAHKLGVVVTGYRVRDNKWTLIGKGDPKRPQAFYDVASNELLQPGDTLAARCTYNSVGRDTTTYIGATGADEMCNFYLMYYYDPEEGPSTNYCALAQMAADQYPADTDTPLPPGPPMDMKRSVEEGNLDKLTVEEGWPQHNLSADEKPVGQISGVATNSLGDVVIFHRADRVWDMNTFDLSNRLNPDLAKTPISDDPVWFLKEETGEVSRTWGRERFHLPHGLSIDHENNMWFTDVGMHQVFKFSRQGDLLLTLGEKFVPGSDHQHFCKPTDVAIETNGDFFVSDGYCNSRILKFSPQGNFLFVIGDLSQMPSLPPPRSFLVPHSASLGQNTLYVADRENGRVLAFDQKTGQFKRHYNGFGDKVFAVSYSSIQGGTLYVINGKSGNENDIHGFTFNIPSAKVVQKWSPKESFIYPHDLTSSGNFVYVAEITKPGKLWKFRRTSSST